jgi:hypothetical protein
MNDVDELINKWNEDIIHQQSLNLQFNDLSSFLNNLKNQYFKYKIDKKNKIKNNKIAIDFNDIKLSELKDKLFDTDQVSNETS